MDTQINDCIVVLLRSKWNGLHLYFFSWHGKLLYGFESIHSGLQEIKTSGKVESYQGSL